MSVIADDDHVCALFSILVNDPVDLFYKRAGRIHNVQPLILDLPVNPFWYAMGTDHDRSIRDIRQLLLALNDTDARSGQFPDDFFVVDDRPIRINRLSSFCDLALHLIYSTLHAKAEPGCFCHYYFHN